MAKVRGSRLPIAAFVLILGACGGPPDYPGTRAFIKAADGTTVAYAEVRYEGDALEVEVEGQGLAPGTYGVHLHEKGECRAPDFESAGAHWNPTGRQHGTENPQGRHHGDLPNLTIDDNRIGRLVYRATAPTREDGSGGLYDEDGASVVIHAQPDDYRTDPSGSSGARIACGTLARPG